MKKVSEVMLSGKINLANMQEALKMCPDTFKKDCPWTNYAAKFLVKPASTLNWKWRILKEERYKWIFKLAYLLSSPNYKIEDRICIGGWMLSEMLREIPEYQNLAKK